MSKMALSQCTEIPSASSFSSPKKTGNLRKLTRRGWLYPGSWKNRFCVLDETKLYFYENQGSRGSERNTGVLNLDYFDLCEEGKHKDKRASNVFVISTSVRGIFDLQTRHFFAADTLPEMNDWVAKIRLGIGQARSKRSRAGRSKDKNNPQTENRSKSDGPLSDSTEGSPEDERSERAESRLYTPTKNRAKGPQGRRPPQRKSMLATNNQISDGDSEEGPQRARSMSALECITETDNTDNSWLTSPLEDLSGSENRSASQNALVYKYSSSEESIGPVIEAKGRVKQLSKILNIPTGQNKASPGGGVNRGPPSPRSPGSPGMRPPLPSQGYSQQHSRQLSSIEGKVAGLEQEMVVTRSDLATVHGGLAKTQTELERLTLRMERIGSQVIQVERQITNMLNDAQKYYDDAERSLKEAQEAKEEFVRLQKECFEVLTDLKAHKS